MSGNMLTKICWSNNPRQRGALICASIAEGMEEDNLVIMVFDEKPELDC